MKNSMRGLGMREGREINTRTPGESGIARACSIKKAKENQEKIHQIAAGISLAKNVTFK